MKYDLYFKKIYFSLGLQIEVLPEIVEAVRGTGVEVYLDSGVRLGTDVLKALALGARAVFVGRPVIWGLAYKVPKKIYFISWNQIKVLSNPGRNNLFRCRHGFEIILLFNFKTSVNFHSCFSFCFLF